MTTSKLTRDELKPEESLGFLRAIGRWVVRRFYGRITVTGGERIPVTGPVLICGNHANALLDAVLLGVSAKRPVRFLAKAPLFDVPVLGRVLLALGMIPTFRAQDDPRQVKRSLESLNAGATALANGHVVGIFPEGKSTDPLHLEALRSGAARIAIQAVDAGATGLKIVPVGMVYEAKERSGTDVWLRVGEPIEVDVFLAAHGGHARQARNALTAELEQRLKSIVVHLDDPAWEPWLNDLELLLPAGKGGDGPLPQRKRIADAINHFKAADQPKADAVAAQITAYRDQVHAAGLQVDSPMLRLRAWQVAVLALWDAVRLALGLLPAVFGTMHHIAPFVVVRLIAGYLDHPGNKTKATHRVMAGLPIYGLWYAFVGWWMFDYYSNWFAMLWLALMPFAGFVALSFWRRLGVAAPAAWSHLAIALQRRRLRELRAAGAALQAQLRTLAEEYAQIAPKLPAPPRRRRRDRVLRACGGLAAVALIGIVGWVGAYRLREATMLGDGLDLAAMRAPQLRAELDGDVPALKQIMGGLRELESDARVLQREFAQGTRSYVRQGDNDAVRELLRRYLTYRSALLRLFWKYQRHAEVPEIELQMEAFLVDYAAISLLFESALKFVHDFDRSGEAVAKLNEGEPNWDIPAGLYDEVRRNLSNPANQQLLTAARALYRERQGMLEQHGLGPEGRCAHLHAAIARAESTVTRIDPTFQNATVALSDLAGLVNRVRYDTQSALSTWIGDFKVRKPRGGRSPITPAQLAQLRGRLEPGDILLERRNWYLSNAFLPGFWPHGAVYVGTVADLSARGLLEEPHVRAHLAEFANTDQAGHTHVIIEAVSEGVVFSSMEHSIGEADAVAVLRANLPPDQINASIVRAFSFVGRPYDFEFDFSSTDKLVCTEVVFRAYGGNSGPLTFPVVEIMGRPTMPAINLVEKYRDERDSGAPQLTFIAFIDSDHETGASRFVTDDEAFIGTLDRAGLTWLQGLEQGELRSLRGIGWRGWVLAALTLLALAGNGGLWWTDRRRGVTA